MEFFKFDRDALSEEDYRCIFWLEQCFCQKTPDVNRLKFELTAYDVYGFRRGKELAGFAVVNPKSMYVAGGVDLLRLRYSWELNKDHLITYMIRKIAAQYCPAKYIIMDIDKTHDINRQLYKRIGFEDSLIRSPIQRGNVVIFAEPRDLANGR